VKKAIACFVILCGIVSYALAGAYVKEPAIKEIVASDKYIGSTVELKGVFIGWGGKIGPPPVTKSDYIIEDKTGQIHVSGRLPKGISMKDAGKKITIKGTVRSTVTDYMGVKKKVIYMEVR
jgi:hypothetical protein